MPDLGGKPIQNTKTQSLFVLIALFFKSEWKKNSFRDRIPASHFFDDISTTSTFKHIAHAQYFICQRTICPAPSFSIGVQFSVCTFIIRGLCCWNYYCEFVYSKTRIWAPDIWQASILRGFSVINFKYCNENHPFRLNEIRCSNCVYLL